MNEARSFPLKGPYASLLCPRSASAASGYFCVYLILMARFWLKDERSKEFPFKGAVDTHHFSARAPRLPLLNVATLPS